MKFPRPSSHSTHFDPNGLSMNATDAHFIFMAYEGASQVLRIQLARDASADYRLRGVLKTDTMTLYTDYVPLSDGPHYLEFGWAAASGSGANDGYFELFIDGVSQIEWTNLDTDGVRIDTASLGAVKGIESGTRGTYYFDAFESRSSGYIGPAGGDPGGTETPTPSPTANAYDSSFGGGTCDTIPCYDAFVVQLEADGSAFRYATYLGGGDNDSGYALALDASGRIYVSGRTRSGNFPVANAYDGSHNGNYDAFVAQLDPGLSGSASLLYSTYLGGGEVDYSLGIAVDGAGHAYVTGLVKSSNFPTLNPYQASLGGPADAFVAQFDLTQSGSASLLYSSYLGGSGVEHGLGIAVDGEQAVYATGYTFSSDLPLAGALQSSLGGGKDAFLSKLDFGGSVLVYSTYLGGSADEEGAAVAVDGSGDAYLTGYTKSANFPLADPFQAAKGADSCGSPPCADAFVSLVNASGSALVYSSYLGGAGSDYGTGIAVDGQGNAYLTGYTLSGDFPTTPGAYDLTYGGNAKSDAFVAKVSAPAPPPPSSFEYNWHYEYDGLYRLTYACPDWEAATSTCLEDAFTYSYDAVGNRLSETIGAVTTNYTYDIANRLTAVNGVNYTWDNNGNLLSDGVNTYTYDHANRLASVVRPSSTSSYAYNGLGDRSQQTVDSVITNYTLDINTWLTQVLADGSHTYLYGNSRIAQFDSAGGEYFLNDALGSVRQLADAGGEVMLAEAYQPYGETLTSAGEAETSYGFAGEWVDTTGLIFLRARYYASYLNQFIQPDPILPDPYFPADWNRYTYVRNSPVNLTDPPV